MHDIIDFQTLQIVHEFGPNVIRRSCMILSNGPAIIRNAMFSIDNKRDIEVAIEIGTCTGTTTALMSRYAKKVITIDIQNGQLAEMGYENDLPVRIWEHLGIKNIQRHVVKGNDEKYDLLSKLEYDFCFLDGDHSDKNIGEDWDIAKKCKRVLFHNYGEQFPLQKKIIDSLPKDECLFYYNMPEYNKNQKLIDDIFVLWDKATLEKYNNAFYAKLETGKFPSNYTNTKVRSWYDSNTYTIRTEYYP